MIRAPHPGPSPRGQSASFGNSRSFSLSAVLEIRNGSYADRKCGKLALRLFVTVVFNTPQSPREVGYLDRESGHLGLPLAILNDSVMIVLVVELAIDQGRCSRPLIAFSQVPSIDRQ